MTKVARPRCETFVTVGRRRYQCPRDGWIDLGGATVCGEHGPAPRHRRSDTEKWAAAWRNGKGMPR